MILAYESLIVYFLVESIVEGVKVTLQAPFKNVQIWESTTVDVRGLARSDICLN